MHATEVIARYVDDVTRRLPRRQRDDVAMELLALLREELEARAQAAGHAPDETIARALVVAFGRPAEVAARYRPPVVVIDPAETRAFLWLSGAGLGIIWAVGLAVVAAAPSVPGGGALIVLRDWWLGVVIP